MIKKPSPVEYDESIVQRLPPVSGPRRAGHSDFRRWSGGFFNPGRRNPDPSAAAADPLDLMTDVENH